MDLYAEIRRVERVEQLSGRVLAKRFGVSRDTVALALAGAEPPTRKTPVRSAPRLDRFKSVIDAMLIEDLDAPRKQKHTAVRVLDRLVREHGTVDLSYSTVRDYVARRRGEINADAGRATREVHVPQEHAPGAEAEVDFGEAEVFLDGEVFTATVFVFRLSHSGKAVHRVYSTASQESFLQGHIDAFEELGGVPARHIRYDNLSSAVTRVVFGAGRARVENDRWVLFRSHYRFDPFYCRPGLEGAHEKGGVEGEVGRFRRNRLVPRPVVSSLAELNDLFRQWDAEDDTRRITGKSTTIGHDFAIEQPLLSPLPGERFEPGLALEPRVDRSALITVRQAKYSVPAHLIGRRVRVALRADEVVVFDGRAEVARHERVARRFGQAINLDHYLEVLKHKPGAFPGSTALAQAREAGTFTSAHEAFWQHARRVNGDRAGTRELIAVLLLHRAMRTVDVIAGIEAALSVGAVSADVVAVEARLHAAAAAGPESGRHPVEHAPERGERVVSLTQRRLMDPAAVIAGLPPDRRPLPTVSVYDELLQRRPGTPATTIEKEGTTNT